jgi:hypothetical protein
MRMIDTPQGKTTLRLVFSRMRAGIAQSFVTIIDSNNELNLSKRIFAIGDLTQDLPPQKIITGAARISGTNRGV